MDKADLMKLIGELDTATGMLTIAARHVPQLEKPSKKL